MMHRTSSPLTVILALLFILVSLQTAHAAWSDDPTFNTAVSYSEMHHSTSAADGAGGVFVLSYYLTAGNDKRHYIQYIDADGNRTFTNYGTEFYTSADGWDSGVQVVAAGGGGAFVTWSEDDGVMGKVYTQHFGADGSPSWASNLGVCTYASDQRSPQIVSDGYGGGIVGWIDGANLIFSQRFNALGDLYWHPEGALSCLTSVPKFSLDMASGDDPGQALFVWHEPSAGVNIIVAQMLDGAGNREFMTSTLTNMTSTFGEHHDPQVISNGSGGMIATFLYDPSGVGNGPFDVLIQIKSAQGDNHWNNGAAMGGFNFHQDNPQLATDGAGGAFIGYLDHGNGECRAAVKHMNADFSFNWGVYGRTLYDTGALELDTYSMIADGQGGFFTAIEDPTDNNHLKANHYDVDGNSLWMSDSGYFCDGPAEGSIDLHSNGSGGVLTVWGESGANTYAQRIDELGFMGLSAPSLTSITDMPNDQGGEVVLTWQASSRDCVAKREITDYSLWIRQAAKATQVSFQLPDLKDSELADMLKMSEGEVANLKSIGWTYTGLVPAILAEQYSALCPTFGDSTETEFNQTDFMVMAHHVEIGIAWPSLQILTGDSVDNLAPGAPLNLAGDLDGNSVNLNWLASGYHDEDLAFYRIYRGDAAGFQPDENTMLIETANLAFVDLTVAADAWYQVTAVDVHGNEGISSNEVTVLLGASAVEEMPQTFYHRGNYPNPFNPMTNIAFDLPADAQVRITVYDAGGRLVADLVNESFSAGQHQVRWNGQDASGRSVSSGVYYSRIEAGSWSSTRTMTLVR